MTRIVCINAALVIETIWNVEAINKNKWKCGYQSNYDVLAKCTVVSWLNQHDCKKKKRKSKESVRIPFGDLKSN